MVSEILHKKIKTTVQTKSDPKIQIFVINKIKYLKFIIIILRSKIKALKPQLKFSKKFNKHLSLLEIQNFKNLIKILILLCL